MNGDKCTFQKYRQNRLIEMAKGYFSNLTASFKDQMQGHLIESNARESNGKVKIINEAIMTRDLFRNVNG